MSIVQTQKAKPAAGNVPSRAFVRWGTLMRLLAPLIQGGRISLDGIEAQEVAGGVHLRARSGDTKFPLVVNSDGSVVPGIVANMTPSINGTLITHDPPPRLNIGNGMRWAVLAIQADLDKIQGSYVQGATVKDVEIMVQSSAPQPSDLVSSSGRFKTTLATFNNGVKTGQFHFQSLNVMIVDDGSGEGKGELFIF
jgi:hypothetical protein